MATGRSPRKKRKLNDSKVEETYDEDKKSKSIIESWSKYEEYKDIVLSGGNTMFGGNDAIINKE